MVKENKNQILREAAGDFTNKASMLSSVLEIAIAGSVAGGDPYPNDLDISLILNNIEELAQISKYARQMSKYYHGWEVFLFDKNLLHLGRVCHRRECPSQSVDCCVPGCGDPPHLRIHSGFKYDEKIYLSSPFDILYTSLKESCLLARKSELGITESRIYPVLEDVKIKCAVCGRIFIYTAGEQKWYKGRGYSQPKRCPGCRENKYINDF
ncbi:MAG: zinc-ribbon domain-containing protein [Actinomycetia bacterium]|nr:zinc-ribbon domain-containing protein [Actinomycetes bacterium]